MESAARDNMPLVIYFPSEGATDAEFSGVDIARLSQNNAVFIKVPFTTDREKSPWLEETVVPTSRLLSDNPSRDYKVPVGKATVIVADAWGNEYYRTTSIPTVTQLRGWLVKVSDRVEKENAKLAKNLEKAREAVQNSNRKDAVKLLLTNFKDGVVGLEAQEESIRLYHEIMDATRTEVSELKAAGNKTGLQALLKDFKKTDVEKEIDEAIKSLK